MEIGLNNNIFIYFIPSNESKNKTLYFVLEDEYTVSSFKQLFSHLNQKGFDIYYSFNNENEHLDEISKFFKEKNLEFTLVSFGKGDLFANKVSELLEPYIIKRIVISPTVKKVTFNKPTLIMYGDKDNTYKAEKIVYSLFLKNRLNKDVHFICYPNYSYAIHLGKQNSHNYKVNDTCDLNILDDEFLTDFNLYVNDGEVKEKVAIVSENHLPFLNGVNVLTDLLKGELEKKGIKVYVLTLKLYEHDYIKAPDKNIKPFKGFLLPGKVGKIQALYTTFDFNGCIKKIRPMQLDYIHLQNEYSLSKITMKVSKLDKIPFYYTNHTLWDIMFKTKFKGISGIVNFFANAILFKPCAKYAHVMTVPTEKVVKIWEKKGKKNNIVSLPSAIDVNKYVLNEDDKIKIANLRKTMGLENNFVIGFIGRISFEKTIDEIINYLSKAIITYPNLKFVVVGYGEALEFLKKLAKRNQLENHVIFVGEISNDQVKYYYGLFDAFVTASTFESQGLTYVEAMSAGCPLLVRDDTCLDNFVYNKVNGFRYTNYDEFITYLDLLMNNQEVRENIYKASRKTLINFDKTVWANKTYKLYKEAEKIMLDPKYQADLKAITALKLDDNI